MCTRKHKRVYTHIHMHASARDARANTALCCQVQVVTIVEAFGHVCPVLLTKTPWAYFARAVAVVPRLFKPLAFVLPVSLRHSAVKCVSLESIPMWVRTLVHRSDELTLQRLQCQVFFVLVVRKLVGSQNLICHCNIYDRTFIW